MMPAPKRSRTATKAVKLQAPPPPKPPPQKLPIVRRHLVGPDEPFTSLEVFCPSQEATVPADRCAECGFVNSFPHNAGEAGATLECSPPDTQARLDARHSPRIDMAEAAARVPLGEVVHRELVCVTPDTSIEKLISLMNEHALDGVPVVDASWHPVGIVSKTDLMMNGDSYGVVSDVMNPFVHSLPESARLSHAVALMATESIHQIPIVTQDGAVIGLVSSLDCLRWMAKQMGY
jgi:CBS domain-containing protein